MEQKKYPKYCRNPKCGRFFMGTRPQMYCCLECRGSYASTAKDIKPDRTLDEEAVAARALGMSYGQYKAAQYLKKRRK